MYLYKSVGRWVGRGIGVNKKYYLLFDYKSPA